MITPSLFDNVRSAPALVLALFVGLHVALKAVFFSLPFYTEVARPVEHATGGLVTPIVLAALLEVAVLVLGVMVGAGGLRPRDLGLEGGHLPNAAIVVLLLWGAVQAVAVAQGTSGLGRLDLHPAYAGFAPLPFSGRLLDAFFGSAFIEEVMYRGFLLPQLYLLARRRWPSDPVKPLLFAVGAVQLYFGLNHLPAALRMLMPPAEVAVYLVHATLAGALFAALYLRTGNLFVAVAAHALINNPAVPFVAGVDPSLLMLVAVCLLLLGWPALHRRFGEVFTLAAPPALPEPGGLARAR